jgi:hypothetical protein
VASRHTGGERSNDVEVLHILIVDFCQPAEPGALKILCGPNPLSVVGVSRRRVAAGRRRTSAGREGDSGRLLFLAIPFAGTQERAACEECDEEPTIIAAISCTFAWWHQMSYRPPAY